MGGCNLRASIPTGTVINNAIGMIAAGNAVVFNPHPGTKSCCIVTILGGRLVFKEKGTGFKLCCATVIITGIVLGTL